VTNTLELVGTIVSGLAGTNTSGFVTETLGLAGKVIATSGLAETDTSGLAGIEMSGLT